MQVLFVLRVGKIAFWKFSRGSLKRGSLSGKDWNDYTPTFWNEWSDVNQPGESEDAILLSDRPDEPIELPPWFNRPDNEASKWTLEKFSKIVNDGEFAGKGVGIYLGTKKYDFSSGSPEETFWFYPRKGNLCSQFAAAKDKPISEASQRAVAEVRKGVEGEKQTAEVELTLKKEETKNVLGKFAAFLGAFADDVKTISDEDDSRRVFCWAWLVVHRSLKSSFKIGNKFNGVVVESVSGWSTNHYTYKVKCPDLTDAVSVFTSDQFAVGGGVVLSVSSIRKEKKNIKVMFDVVRS